MLRLRLIRKGISCLVLERSQSIRAAGAAITIRTNGWHALDHLGVGSKLRKTAVPLEGAGNMDLDKGTQLTKTPIKRNGEARCILRSDLINALADDLPPGTIRFGCHVCSVKQDPVLSYPVLNIHDGSVIKAKVLIGCDGVNSVVLDYLEMNPTKMSAMCAVRGFTNYHKGHGFENLFLIAKKGQLRLGRVPLTNSLVYWFITRLWTPKDETVSKNQKQIKISSVETLDDFPEEMREMIKKSDEDSLSCMQFRYRPPWELMVGSYRKGTATVAGDALHAMSPFLAQGGSVSIEDAIILAHKISEVDSSMEKKYEEALEQYLKTRRLRLIRLSTQSYVITKLAETSSIFVKLFCIAVLVVFFRDFTAHAEYDCRQSL